MFYGHLLGFRDALTDILYGDDFTFTENLLQLLIGQLAGSCADTPDLRRDRSAIASIGIKNRMSPGLLQQG